MLGKPRVLLVDDEPQILSSVRLNLSRSFDVEVSDCPRRAIVMLVERGNFDVVISDLRMPEFDGIAFLRHARELAPTTSRILMSAYADLDSVLNAVNKAGVHRILRKPCPTPDLIRAVDEAVEACAVSNETEVSEVMIEGLPEKLVNLDRAAKIGQLAGQALGGLTDISAIVATVADQLDVLVASHDDVIVEMLDELRWSAGRLDSIATGFRELHREPRTYETLVDVEETVRDVHSRLQRVDALNGVEVEVDTIGRPSDICISRGYLELILVNLIMNAVAAAKTSAKSPRVLVEVEWRGSDLQVVVSDNGPGVHPRLEARLFEPYFSGNFERAGLGLAVSQQLARSLGARLEFRRPAVGVGSRFVISFPSVRTVSVEEPTFVEEAAPEMTESWTESTSRFQAFVAHEDLRQNSMKNS